MCSEGGVPWTDASCTCHARCLRGDSGSVLRIGDHLLCNEARAFRNAGCVLCEPPFGFPEPVSGRAGLVADFAWWLSDHVGRLQNDRERGFLDPVPAFEVRVPGGGSAFQAWGRGIWSVVQGSAFRILGGGSWYGVRRTMFSVLGSWSVVCFRGCGIRFSARCSSFGLWVLGSPLFGPRRSHGWKPPEAAAAGRTRRSLELTVEPSAGQVARSHLSFRRVCA